MVKVLFVCLGNICRSPMAECVFAAEIKKRGLQNRVEVSSAATSFEEVGNGIYPPARKKLIEKGVPVLPHVATRVSPADKARYDLIVGMEKRNVDDIIRVFGGDGQGKVKRLLDFTSSPRDIADPWWTGDFERAFNDIKLGCDALLDFILSKMQ